MMKDRERLYENEKELTAKGYYSGWVAALIWVLDRDLEIDRYGYPVYESKE